MRLILGMAAIATLTGLGLAQEPANSGDTRPAYEVASVRPNTSGGGSMSMGLQPGGRFTAVNSPLRLLLQTAYDFRDSRLIGPAWIDTERFDVSAKAPDDAAAGQNSLMLQRLLEERFRMAVRRETRQMPIYALVTARSDGRLGPALQRSESDCSANRGITSAGGGAGAPSAVPRPACGTFSGGSRIVAGNVTMSAFASSLTRLVDRIVVDRTELNGTFDLEMQWAPETGPSIFTAIQEQLGLRLEPAQGPVEVMVIENIERPAPD